MSTAALTLEQDIWRPKYNPWLVAVIVALAAFMEALDTSITNVAPPSMAGNLGASNDQSTWVRSTIPRGGFFSSTFPLALVPGFSCVALSRIPPIWVGLRLPD